MTLFSRKPIRDSAVLDQIMDRLDRFTDGLAAFPGSTPTPR